MSEKKLLLIDFNGVISYNNFWQDIYDPSHKLYKRRTEINDFVFKDNFPIVKEWMTGKHTLEDIHSLIEKELGIKSNYLLPIFVKGAKEIDISSKILSQLKERKSKNYNVLLVTDNMDSFCRFTRPFNSILDDTFEDVYDSYTTGLLKKDNNGEIFRVIANDLGYSLEDSVLIDDSKSNCELFESIGGSSINVTGENNVLETLKRLY